MPCASVPSCQVTRPSAGGSSARSLVDEPPAQLESESSDALDPPETPANPILRTTSLQPQQSPARLAGAIKTIQRANTLGSGKQLRITSSAKRLPVGLPPEDTPSAASSPDPFPSAAASPDPFPTPAAAPDPFPQGAQPQMQRRASTQLWQRAMRKTALTRLPSGLPPGEPGPSDEPTPVVLSRSASAPRSSGSWLADVAASSAASSPAGTASPGAPARSQSGKGGGWGKAKKQYAAAPTGMPPGFKIGELVLALRRQQGSAQQMREQREAGGAAAAVSPVKPPPRNPHGSREEYIEKQEELAAWLKGLKSNLSLIQRKLLLHGAASKLQALARRRLAWQAMMRQRKLLNLDHKATWSSYWRLEGDDIGPSVVSPATRRVLDELERASSKERRRLFPASKLSARSEAARGPHGWLALGTWIGGQVGCVGRPGRPDVGPFSFTTCGGKAHAFGVVWARRRSKSRTRRTALAQGCLKRAGQRASLSSRRQRRRR